MYAKKLVTTRRAIKNNSTLPIKNNTSHSQLLEPGAFINPPSLHYHFLCCSFVVEGTHGSSEPILLLNTHCHQGSSVASMQGTPKQLQESRVGGLHSCSSQDAAGMTGRPVSQYLMLDSLSKRSQHKEQRLKN
eukprot:648811-Pelagomonas_calceolata.AAC.1